MGTKSIEGKKGGCDATSRSIHYVLAVIRLMEPVMPLSVSAAHPHSERGCYPSYSRERKYSVIRNNAQRQRNHLTPVLVLMDVNDQVPLDQCSIDNTAYLEKEES